MRRLIVVVLIVAVGIGGWYLWANYTIDVHRAADGSVQYVKLVPKAPRGASSDSPAIDQAPAAPAKPSVRIATFNLDGLDEAKLANPQVADALVRVLPRFDVVAVQGVRSKNRGVLVRLVEQLNATGRYYDFATCPTVERDSVPQYNAMLFDAASVEVDRSTVRSVEDPLGRFHDKPLVAQFRVRGPPESEAFTFMLVNVRVDAAHVAAEVDLLADVYRAVRDAGRNEDDIILLGDLEADTDHLGRLAHLPNLTAVVTSIPTTTRGTSLADNILFDRRATSEFTGRSGVLDLIRELDLKPPAALEVSEHLPVWAEFSSYEGGQAGHVAGVEKEVR
jgi:deoxyribonuclease-1-like protein